MNNPSLQLLIRLINEKHSKVKATLNSLLSVLVSENADGKNYVAKTMLDEAIDLKSTLAAQDVPSWLNATIACLDNFMNARFSAYDLLSNIMSLHSQIIDHIWVFDQNSEKAFDFDDIFMRYKSQSKLPELFDEIVNILESIKNSGEVDSLTMINALGKVISTLKKCKDGSFFSLNSAWDFLLNFLNNYLWSELSKFPVLGTALEALSKTICDLNNEMSLLHTNVRDEMVKTVEMEMRFLGKKTSFQFISYDKAGHLMPPVSKGEVADIRA